VLRTFPKPQIQDLFIENRRRESSAGELIITAMSLSSRKRGAGRPGGKREAASGGKVETTRNTVSPVHEQLLTTCEKQSKVGPRGLGLQGHNQTPGQRGRIGKGRHRRRGGGGIFFWSRSGYGACLGNVPKCAPEKKRGEGANQLRKCKSRKEDHRVETRAGTANLLQSGGKEEKSRTRLGREEKNLERQRRGNWGKRISTKKGKMR